MTLRSAAAALLLATAHAASAQTPSANGWPNQKEGDFVITDFRFKSGETLAVLNVHYTTLGTPRRNAARDIVNAVILLHSTSSSGNASLMPTLADELFAPGEPLDAARYFIVIPDGIGRGGSSKPSDGLKGNFPHYHRYEDIVKLPPPSRLRGTGEGFGASRTALPIPRRSDS
jgi:homoserine O-acetyltransferase/O-succinyltransferase